MLTRKELLVINERLLTLARISGDHDQVAKQVSTNGLDIVRDALAKHDTLLEIYHLLGGEGEPEDVVEAAKFRAADLRQKINAGASFHKGYLPGSFGGGDPEK